MKLLFLTSVPLLLFMASSASAAIIYSGLRNIPIPTSHVGVYLDIDNGAVSGSPDTGWDINPFFGGVAIGGSADFQPVRSGTGVGDPVLRLEDGALIAMTLSYSTGETGSGTHLGAPGNFQDGVPGYLGFRFTPNGGGEPSYGWMRLTLTANTPGAVIHDWAWESSGDGIAAGRIPEPASGCYLLSALGILLHRRKRGRGQYIIENQTAPG